MPKLKNKKVLVLTSTFPRWAGDTNPPFVFELSRRLAKNLDITILTPHFPGAKTYELMDGLKVYRYRYFFPAFEKLADNGGILPTLKANKWYYITIPFFLFFEIIATLKLVKKIKPDIIHAHWIIPSGFAAYVNYLINKTPYMVTSHGGDIFGLQNKHLIKLKKIVLRKAKSITVVSSAIKKEIIKIDPTLKSKINIIPMGVDSNLFNPNKYDKSLKEKYGTSGPFLLFVGRLVEKKGIKYLIQAMAEILKKYPNTKLLVVGSGPLETELKNLTEKLQLSPSIIFTGAIQNIDLPKYYATADIFICPSIITEDGDREGLPVTLMEALASGCFVITTKTGGILDIIKNNITGFLIKEENYQSISKMVIKLLNIRKEQLYIKNNLRTLLASKYSWDNVTRKYFDLFGK